MHSKKIMGLLIIATLMFQTVFISAKDNLIILCGITMKTAIEEITANFTKEYGTTFQVSYSGSGDLQKMIQNNKIGDIFFPGTDTYIKALEKTGEVTESTFAGENKAVLVIKKGNPLKIKSIKDLTNKTFKIVLAKSTSGSIGKESEKILTKAGILDEVTNNVLYYTTDSKDLVSAIIEGEADVVINWKALTALPANKTYMESIEIPETTPEKLVFGILTYSKDKELAKKFVEYATSTKGRAIFEKHGF